ncbi:MFS transporter [Arthrobacter sp. M2012083]|uniref:MFS transporter n=1 Tax=Arthrobacter sp. M2012083 TaxID=1197706 RepID=UPI0002D5D374|nr:MFS transporter [Arthrobacter sp. M2012083]
MNAETTPQTQVPPEPASSSSASNEALNPQVSKRVAVAAGIGHFLEWFDFAVYGFLAVTIGQLFFPSDNPTVSLLSSLSVFGVAFLFRPMGGLIIGAWGDRLGRKSALSLAIILMGICTLGIGLLPTYETIGIAAPILLVVLRCAQGFSAGGEYAGAATFLIEYAPNGRRGLWSSVVSAGAAIGVMGGGVVTLLLASSLSSEEMAAWGWRVPFIVAGPLAVLGLYLRLRLEDTPVFLELQRAHDVDHAPLRSASKKSRSGILLVFTCTAVTGLGFYYLATFVITFLTVKVAMPRTAALELAILGLLVYSAMCPVAGMLGDKIGRRKTMLIGTVGIAVVTIPCFMILGTGNWWLGLLALVVFAAFEALVNVMLGVLMVELFPARLRVSGSSIGFNVAQALIGGPGPFIATAIASAFAFSAAPAFYLAFIAVICFFVLLRYLPETRGVSLSSNGTLAERSQNAE